ncbi:LysR family transcriptional regulator [Methylopila turkensis]|uniref:Transcriptional regulator n=1 Tax=Methylopila turkensis TaxID=1437816 RepID=A0A9W6JPM0_9HYPH|nr:LysR family transcriptional regulator [Methylopila turkensis]GLK80088.1 transcriptional regulator [Methylopila turkensis]
MQRPSLNDLEAFVAVADNRSFRKAAERLGVSRSALSHALRELELKLGVRLLHRTTRSVSTTDAGARLLARLRPALDDLDAAFDVVAEARGKPSGSLRINAGKVAARFLMRRLVPEYLARFPDVEVDLVSEGRLIDIVEHGFDAGVRLGEAVPQDMIGVKLLDETRFVAVASPGYFAEHGQPETPLALARHRCIRQRLPSGKRYRWEFGRHGEEIAIDVPGVLTLDDNDLMVEAAAAGEGVAYVPELAALDRLSDGRLVATLDDWCPSIPGLMLYYPGRRHVPSPLRAFIDLATHQRQERGSEGSAARRRGQPTA